MPTAAMLVGRWGRSATLLVVLLLCLRPGVSRADIETIEATGRYHLGDNDTKLVGHRLALMEAKRNALEKAGTYVESITEVKDYQLTRDEIHTYSAGILRVEETKEPQWDMVGKNLEVTVFVRVSVDKKDVAQKIGSLRKDTETIQQLKDSQKQVDENERKVKKLNQQLKTAKKGAPATKRAQAARAEALENIDSSTLKAQAAVAEKLSVEAYNSTRAYMERQLPAIKGCWRSMTSSGEQHARADPGLALVAGPAVVLMICKPRKTDANRTRKENL